MYCNIFLWPRPAFDEHFVNSNQQVKAFIDLVHYGKHGGKNSKKTT